MLLYKHIYLSVVLYKRYQIYLEIQGSIFQHQDSSLAKVVRVRDQLAIVTRHDIGGGGSKRRFSRYTLDGTQISPSLKNKRFSW